MLDPGLANMNATERPETSALLERVMDSLRERFAVIDHARTILAVNVAALPHDLTKEDILGKNVFEIYPNLVAQGLVEVIDRVFETGEPHIELYVQHQRSDGFTGYHHRKIIPLKHGDTVEAVSIIIENVHEERVAQLRARQFEVEYKELIEHLRLVSFELDATGKFVYVNNAVSPLFGYSPSDLIGKPFTRFVVDEDVGHMWHVFWQIVNQGRPSGVSENRFRTASERVVHMRWNIHPVYDIAGKIVGCRGVGEDITEAAERISALEESRGLFQQTFQVLPHPVFIVKNGEISGMNRAAHRIVNAVHEHMLHRPFIELFVEEDRPRARTFLHDVNEHGRMHFDARLQTNTETYVLHHLLGTRVRDGIVVAFDGKNA